MRPREVAVLRRARAIALCAWAREEVATSRNHRHAHILRRHLAKRRAAA